MASTNRTLGSGSGAEIYERVRSEVDWMYPKNTLAFVKELSVKGLNGNTERVSIQQVIATTSVTGSLLFGHLIYIGWVNALYNEDEPPGLNISHISEYLNSIGFGNPFEETQRRLNFIQEMETKTETS